MWCIGELTEEYRRRMYALLALYAKPLNPLEPVVCIDEKSLQLVAHSRAPLPMSVAQAAKQDVRKGTCNLFVAVEAKAGQRTVVATEHRGKVEFVDFVACLLATVYAGVRVHLVLDNLNIHFAKSFHDVLGRRAAQRLLSRVVFHHTPKHASWLNMAEIELGILTRQCLDRRMPDHQMLQSEVQHWQDTRNAAGRTIEWKFTRQDADRKLGHHCVPLFT
ncbi:MAG: putative transposase [Ramlibacter sp.]|jgi:hypothetical protein|nr:putative transposase [Ramlibacter sp.]